jgi:hypothetical protein
LTLNARQSAESATNFGRSSPGTSDQAKRQPGGVKARANNFMTLNLDEVKKQLAEQIELANKLWLDSEPQRMAADSAMKPWHETNRRIDGLKGLVSILETEGK